jgi:hypothetical protein
VAGNDPVPEALTKGPVKQQMQQLSEGLYETSRYMLLKNKKK